MDCFEPCGVLINGEPIAKYGAVALLAYSIGETKVTNATFQGLNRTTWRMLKASFGLRQIKITFVFSGETLHQAKLARSALNGALFGRSEIYIAEDGFFYTVSCESFGEEVRIGAGDAEAKIKSEYLVTGIRNGALVTATIPAGGELFCRSTMPFTDCRLTVTVGQAAASYALGGATFRNVAAGDTLVFDGIDGKITKNGQPYAASVDWVHLPALTPGINRNTAADPVRVEFYPAYI